MDINKLAKDIQRAIESLRSEQEEIDAKIAAMEDALRSLGERSPVAPRRGRPRKVAAATGGASKDGRSRKTPHWSAEARLAAAERMRKYWAERKGASKKTTKKKATRKKAAKKRVVKKSSAAAASE